MCVCVRLREKQGVGVALGVLMTQFPLRGGPPICEWNRQDLAKKIQRVNKKNYVGQEGEKEQES